VDLAPASVAANVLATRGSVTLGAIPTVPLYLIPRYTANFTKGYGDARLRILEEITPVLIESLHEPSIDFALLVLPLRHEQLELQPIQTEPLLAALQKIIRSPPTIHLRLQSYAANLSSCCVMVTASATFVCPSGAARSQSEYRF
jgi:DNA-binding transcriptional LysR family regulator